MNKWQNNLEATLYSENILDKINAATLDVLLNQGVIFQSQEALAIFEDGGAKVDYSERRVYIDPKLVKKSLHTAPSSFVLGARDPRYDFLINADVCGFTTFGVGFSVIDRETGHHRDSTKRDLVESALLGDYLKTLDIYSHAVTARDCPLRSIDLHEAEAFLNNTTKHCMHLDLGHRSNIIKFIEMAGLLVDGVNNLHERPVVSALTCPQSPLCFPAECCDIIMEFAKVGLPVNILPMAISGQTAPATLAGTLVITNAEVLAGLVLSQLTTPGAPVIYGCSSTTFDFFTSTSPVGSPELGLCSSGAASMAKYYKIPSYVAG
ncbi:MAG: trimethylamine methyltransferase family protein, partial [Clostridiales bacterium]